jgi:hypothetical protein
MASDSSDAQKRLRMRRRVAEEIVSTERSYVDSLQAIHDVFAKPMRDRNIVSEQQATTLFSDIQVLFLSLLAPTFTFSNDLPPIYSDVDIIVFASWHFHPYRASAA